MVAKKMKQRNDYQRGAVLVETALVFPLVILFTLAIFEFGLYWRSDLSVSQASKEAARAAAGAGRSVDAATGETGDSAALRIVHNLYRSGAISQIQYVVIYKPVISVSGGQSTYSIPTACRPTSGATLVSQPGQCTVYGRSELQLNNATFDARATRDKAIGTSGWSVTNRCDRYSIALDSQPDLLGVLVWSDYKTATNFPVLSLLDGPQSSDYVIRIEPQNESAAATRCTP